MSGISQTRSNAVFSALKGKSAGNGRTIGNESTHLNRNGGLYIDLLSEISNDIQSMFIKIITNAYVDSSFNRSLSGPVGNV